MNGPTTDQVAGEVRGPVLATENLSAGYFGHPVVSNININVRPGEVVALLGPNGAGKTTTLRALAGEIAPISGTITVSGKQTRSPLYARTRDGIAFVPEERSVFMNLSALENIRVGRCSVEDVLALFSELRPLLRRKAGLLSGGEQQMLTLARALARKPKLLLADELSLGLAPMVVARLLKAVRQVADEQNVGAILVEQHVNRVLQIADRVYVMRAGQIILTGTVAEVAGQLEDVYLGRELT